MTLNCPKVIKSDRSTFKASHVQKLSTLWVTWVILASLNAHGAENDLIFPQFIDMQSILSVNIKYFGNIVLSMKTTTT